MKQINYAFLLILFLILIPFFHIEVTSFLIIILFGVYLLSYVYNLFKSQIDGAESFHLNSPLPLFILLITFFLWFTALKIFDNITLMIYKVFAYGSDFGLGDSPFQITTYAMDKTSLNLFEIFWLILKTWGVIIVFFGVTTIISLSIIIKYKQFIKNKVILLLFAFIFLLLCCLSGILFFKDSVFGLSLRYAKYAVLFGMIIVGYYCINIYFTKKTVLKVISLIIFVLFVSFAVLNLFPSPWINLPNKQITRESFEGSRFFLSYFDQSIGFYEMNTKLSVYYQAFNGVNQFKQQNVVVESVMVSPPAHFGYSRSSTLGKTINANSYLIYNEIAKIYFPSVYPKYPESWAFSPSDFVKLEYDPSVDHIYTNSEIEIYTITT